MTDSSYGRLIYQENAVEEKNKPLTHAEYLVVKDQHLGGNLN
jgi:hypothetical protein